MRAKLFWTGRSQAVRLPKECRFDTDEVLVRREGRRVILEPPDEWPTDWVGSFVHPDLDLERPGQGVVEAREDLD